MRYTCANGVNVPDRFGEPISMDEYKEQFFSGIEGAPRAAVKRLTRAIERELVEGTINAPDWYFDIIPSGTVRTLIVYQLGKPFTLLEWQEIFSGKMSAR